MNEHMQTNGGAAHSGVTLAAAGFVAGALVGAGVALLLAPASGEDTRHRLSSVAHRAGDAARDGIGKAKDAMDHLAHGRSSGIDAGREMMPRSEEPHEARLES